MVTLPDGVLGMAARDESWGDLGGVAARPRGGRCSSEWELDRGRHAPARVLRARPARAHRATARAAMLKISFPHDEAEHEHLALQHWHGDGAVRLLRADPHRCALLLERLHDEELTAVRRRGLRARRRVLRAAARPGPAAAAPPELVRRRAGSDELAALPRGRARAAPARGAGGVARPRLRRATPATDGRAGPRRPALRQRARRRPRAAGW